MEVEEDMKQGELVPPTPLNLEKETTLDLPTLKVGGKGKIISLYACPFMLLFICFFKNNIQYLLNNLRKTLAENALKIEENLCFTFSSQSQME